MSEYNENHTAILIAPCGMNCRICYGYLRRNNPCAGCRSSSLFKPAYCRTCIIINCYRIKDKISGFCYECDKYPCRRLKQLDKRYRTRYNMSMIENLSFIKESGLHRFLEKEKEKWICPHCGAVLCVHRSFCLSCKLMIFSQQVAPE